ncbi:MAG: chemotaxis protein CheW [Thermodesulfovibrionales bacterium]
MKVAVVYAGEEDFGIEIDRVIEILKVQRVHTLPQLPAFLSGVVNIRGDVVPLIDLRKRFGINPKPKKERVIVVRSGNEKVGFLVDGVKEIIDLQPDEIITPPGIFKGLKTEYLTGLGKRGDRIIILLNTETLLTSEEKIQIEEVTTG